MPSVSILFFFYIIIGEYGIEDVSNFNYQGKTVSQMSPDDRKRFAKFVKQAFRLNNETITGN